MAEETLNTGCDVDHLRFGGVGRGGAFIARKSLILPLAGIAARAKDEYINGVGFDQKLGQ